MLCSSAETLLSDSSTRKLKVTESWIFFAFQCMCWSSSSALGISLNSLEASARFQGQWLMSVQSGRVKCLPWSLWRISGTWDATPRRGPAAEKLTQTSVTGRPHDDFRVLMFGRFELSCLGSLVALQEYFPFSPVRREKSSPYFPFSDNKGGNKTDLRVWLPVAWPSFLWLKNLWCGLLARAQMVKEWDID